MKSQAELFKQAFAELMKDVGTSIPGHVLSFDPKTQLAQVQIGVKRVENDGKQVEIPPIIGAPVFIYGGQFSVEIEVSKGDEGLIIFSQRCIDGWVNTGGLANNPALRFHDFSDALFMPGFRSNAKALPSFENNGVRLRNNAGNQHVWLKANGDISMKGMNVDIEGQNMNIATATLTHNGVNIGQTHTHVGVRPGSGSTGLPQ